METLKGVIKIKSITFHNGTKFSREHNRRNEKYTDKQVHIDKNRREQNIIFVDEKLKDSYEKIFAESVKEYNAKQKRQDRKIKNYYEKIKESKNKNLAYECIVQIGTAEDTSFSSEQEQEALKKYFEDWEKRNPNLKIFGAYMHNDEETSHLHIDYIPVAEFEKGMKLQNSLSKALKQQGFIGKGANNTEQMQWQNSERLALEKICTELGINAKANQNLTDRRKHLSVSEYKQARKEMLSEIEKEKEELENKILSYEQPARNFLESAKSYEERAKTHQELQLLKTMREEQQRKQDELAMIKQELQQINSEISEAENRKQNLKNDINNLQTEYDEKIKTIDTAEVIAKQKAQEVYKTEYNKIVEKIESEARKTAKDIIEKAKSDSDELQRTNKEKAQKIDKLIMEEANKLTADNLKKARLQINSDKKMIESARKRIAEKEKSLDKQQKKLEQERDNLQRTIEQMIIQQINEECMQKTNMTYNEILNYVEELQEQEEIKENEDELEIDFF